MTTTDRIPPPPESQVRLRAPVDRPRRPLHTTAMTVDDLLRAQDWPRITAQLTAFAYKRTKKRSWENAQDLAQTAIAQAFVHGSSGWDPEKQPLIRYLSTQVIGLSLNEWRRKRNACEVRLGEKVKERVAGDDEPIDEQVDRRHYAVAFHDRLIARLSGDEIALLVVKLMKEGLSTPRDLAQASGRSVQEIQGARRRIQYQAAQVTTELSGEIEQAERSEEEEVAQ